MKFLQAILLLTIAAVAVVSVYDNFEEYKSECYKKWNLALPPNMDPVFIRFVCDTLNIRSDLPTTTPLPQTTTSVAYFSNETESSTIAGNYTEFSTENTSPKVVSSTLFWAIPVLGLALIVMVVVGVFIYIYIRKIGYILNVNCESEMPPQIKVSQA